MIYDIDERIQKLEKNEVKTRKTQLTTLKRFTAMESFLERKEAEPSVSTISKHPRVLVKSPVKESGMMVQD